MNDRGLETILREMGAQRIPPPARLVERTKARVKGGRLLAVVTAMSLATQLFALGGLLYLLTRPDVQPLAKISALVGLGGYLGSIVVAAVAARGYIADFFRRFERLVA